MLLALPCIRMPRVIRCSGHHQSGGCGSAEARPKLAVRSDSTHLRFRGRKRSSAARSVQSTSVCCTWAIDSRRNPVVRNLHIAFIALTHTHTGTQRKQHTMALLQRTSTARGAAAAFCRSAAVIPRVATATRCMSRVQCASYCGLGAGARSGAFHAQTIASKQGVLGRRAMSVRASNGEHLIPKDERIPATVSSGAWAAQSRSIRGCWRCVQCVCASSHPSYPLHSQS